MKKFFQVFGILVFILIVLLFIALFAGLIFLKTFDIKKYKPQIIQAASQALGRTVDFKDIDLYVSMDQGIRFHLGDLTIAENPDFGTDSFLTVKEANAGVDLLAFVVSRQISVPSILVRSPQVTVIRNAAGVLNVSTIGAKADKAPSVSSGSKALAVPAIFVNSFKIENAQINFIDRTLSPELKLAVSQMTLDVEKFSFTSPFDISLEAAVLAPGKNFSVIGKVQLNLKDPGATLSNMDLAFDLDKLPLEKIKNVPQLASLPLPRILEGKIKVKVHEAELSAKGLGKVNADVFFNNGRIVADDIAPGISVEARQLDLGVENISLDGSTPAKLSLKAALYQDEINIDFSGKVFLDLKKPEIRLTDGEFTTDLALWPIKKIKASVGPLKDAPLPEDLAGKFQTTIKEAVVSAAGLQSILLDAKLQGGTVLLRDIMPGASLALDKTDMSVGNFSFSKQFTVALKTSYLSDKQNISFDGVVILDPKVSSVEIKNGIAGINLNGFDLDRFKTSGFVPANVPFPQTLGGVFQVGINDLNASPKGLGDMNIDLKWQNGKVVLNEVVPGISAAADQVNIKVTDFSLTKPFGIEASLAYESSDPNLNFAGQAAFNPATQAVNLTDMKIKADLGKLPFDIIKTKVAPVKDVKLPDVLKGQLELIIKKLAAGPKGLDSMQVDINLSEGEVAFKEIAPGVSVAATHIDAGIKDFALGSPFDFKVKLAYASAEQDIQVEGNAAVGVTDQTVALKDTKLSVDLSKVIMTQLKNNIAALKDAPLPEKLKGDLSLSIPNATAGAGGLTALTSEVVLKDWEVKLPQLTIPISGKENHIKVTESQLTSEDFAVNVGKGLITVKADVADYMKQQNFNFAADIKGLDLAEVLEQSQSPVKVAGLVTASLKAKGQGADLNSISGDGSFEITEAKLKDLNVLKTVLDKISFIPNLESRVEAKLPDQYKAKLEDKDTKINKVSGTCVIANGHMTLDPISVEADEFNVSGTAQAAFDQTYSFDGAFKITPELSAIMGNSSEELRYLFDSSNNISLPIHVSGQGSQAPAVAITQSAVDITKNAARNEGKKQLGKILDKALRIPENAPAQDPSQNSDQPASGGETTGSQIIGGILNRILK